MPKLQTILLVPTVRPLQDDVFQRDGGRGDNHCVQAPHNEQRLEPSLAWQQDEELLKGLLEGVLDKVHLEEVLKEALKRALGKGLE